MSSVARAANQMVFKTTVSVPAIIFSGTNGLPGSTYYVLASTSVAAPLTDWVVVQTNVFDASGHFSVTNAVEAAKPVQFFRLQLP